VTSSPDPTPTKHPGKVRAGQIGSRRRWGPQRILRLDQLQPIVREAVLALIAAHEAAEKARSDDAS
jgi:hypothetical protein